MGISISTRRVQAGIDSFIFPPWPDRSVGSIASGATGHSTCYISFTKVSDIYCVAEGLYGCFCTTKVLKTLQKGSGDSKCNNDSAFHSTGVDKAATYPQIATTEIKTLLACYGTS